MTILQRDPSLNWLSFTRKLQVIDWLSCGLSIMFAPQANGISQVRQTCHLNAICDLISVGGSNSILPLSSVNDHSFFLKLVNNLGVGCFRPFSRPRANPTIQITL